MKPFYLINPKHKSLTVGLLGAPNVGKSSLVNCLQGMDLSIVSPKPQTTRNRFLSIFHVDDVEIILQDTPGLHTSNQELNIRMNNQAMMLDGCDLVCAVIDTKTDLVAQIESFLKTLQQQASHQKDFEDLFKKQWWLIIQKADLIDDQEKFQQQWQSIQKDWPVFQKIFSVSAETEGGIHLLISALLDHAPKAPHLFPEGDISNKNERFFVAEFIREQVFLRISDEIPYEVAVVVDSFQDNFRKDEQTGEEKLHRSEIAATILVNRPSQRAIIIGSGGKMIREIGQQSREKLEKFLDRKIYLKLHVKASPKWFRNNFVLEEIGLPRAPRSQRVWRQQ